MYSGDTNDLAGRLEQGLLDFAVIAQEVNLRKYNYLELPWADTWGVVMRKDNPLSEKESIGTGNLLGRPIIVSRQGLQGDLPRLLGEKADRLNVTATINLTYNGTLLVREGMGYLLTFDKLADTGERSELCFRPLAPRLETKLYFIWKKYQVFTPVAELLLEKMKEKDEDA